jgi:hypothetical protein
MGYACIAISLDFIPFIDGDVFGHWEENVWVEPERRYNFGETRQLLQIPESWQFVQDRKQPTVWVEFYRGEICIAVQSDEFPEVPQGQALPRIYVAVCVEIGDFRERRIVFDHFDMHEVDALRNR